MSDEGGTSGTRGAKRQIKARLEHDIDDALYAEIAPFMMGYGVSAEA